jgi:hypothetical protein
MPDAGTGSAKTASPYGFASASGGLENWNFLPNSAVPDARRVR